MITKNNLRRKASLFLIEHLESRLVLASPQDAISQLEEMKIKSRYGDRGGAYIDFARFQLEAGADRDAIAQIVKQAGITTGGGRYGGGAMLANARAMSQAGNRYDVSLDEFSTQIQLRAIDAAMLEISRSPRDFPSRSDRDGVLTKEEYLVLDYSKWNDKGIAREFPGNFDMFFAYDAITQISSNSIVWEYIDRSQILPKADLLKSSLIISESVASWADSMGFKPSDYGFSNEASQVPGVELISNDTRYSMAWDVTLGGVFVVRDRVSGKTPLVYSPTTDSNLLNNSDWGYRLLTALGIQGLSTLETTAPGVAQEIMALMAERTFLLSSPDGQTRELKLSVFEDVSPQDRLEFQRSLGFLVDKSDYYPRNDMCFAKGTPIRMADGTTKNIELVEEGDLVLAFTANEPPIACRVERTFRNNTFRFIELPNGVRVTPEHPFLVENGRFLPIEQAIRNRIPVVFEDGSAAIIAGSLRTSEEPEATYNLSVERLHTYIAGGFRVHNLSIMHFLSPSEQSVDAGWLADGSQYILSITQDNVIVKRVGRADLDADPDTDLFFVENVYAQSGTTITETWTQFDTSDKPVGSPAYSVRWYNELIDGDRLGIILGPQLMGLLGLTNPFARLSANILGTAVVSNSIELLVDLGQSLLNDARIPNGYENMTEFLLRKTFNDISRDFPEAMRSQSASAIASLIVAEAAETLGINGFAGQVFTVGGTTVANQITTNLLEAMFNRTPITESILLNGFKKLDLLNSFGSALGSSLAAKIAGNLINVQSVGESLASSVGGAYASISGAALVSGSSVAGGLTTSIAGSLFGQQVAKALGAIILPGIGAFIGTLIGQVAGSKIFDFVDRISGGFFSGIFAKSVWHYQYLDFDSQTQTFVRGNDESKNTTHTIRDGTYSIADAYIESINHILSLIGGKVDEKKYRESLDNVAFAFVGREAPWDGKDDWRVVFGQGGDYVDSNGDVAKIVRIALEHQLSQLSISNGKPLMMKAFEAWKIEQNHTPLRDGDSLTSLMANLELAREVERYEDNVVLMNSFIKNDPRSVVAMAWVATLMQWQGINAKAADTLIDDSKLDFERDDTESGMYRLTRSLEFAPRRTTTIKRLAEEYLKKGDYDAAIYSLQLLVGIDDSIPETWNTLADALIKRGGPSDREGAIYSMERYLGLKPSDGIVLQHLAKLYFEAGNTSKARYLLARARDLGVFVDLSGFPRAGAADLVAYISAAQLPNGAVQVSSDPSAYDTHGHPVFKVDPYFASFAIAGLLTSASLNRFDVQDVAERYFKWYLANVRPDGTIDVHWYFADGSVATEPTSPDSNDSYASMFLVAIERFRLAGFDTAFFRHDAVKTKLTAIVSLLLRLQQPNGLTTTFQDPSRFQALYTQDNSESFAGFRSVASFFSEVYGDDEIAETYLAAAERVRSGVVEHLFDERTGRFLVGLFLNRDSGKFDMPVFADLESWYPGTTPIVWPILFDVVSPQSSIAIQQIQWVKHVWNGSSIDRIRWSQRTDSAAMALVFAKLGDANSAIEALSSVSQGPYPTVLPVPNLPRDIAVTSIGDTGLALMAFVALGLTVTTTADSGLGSLRNAIQAATSLGGSQIGFALSNDDIGAIDIGNAGTDYWVFRPSSPLPAIGSFVTISGLLGHDGQNTPPIILDGRFAGSTATGLQVVGTGVTVENVMVGGFGGTGIYVDGSWNHIIENYFGDFDLADLQGNGKFGITISDNSFMNVISSNAFNEKTVTPVNVSRASYLSNSIRFNTNNGVRPTSLWTNVVNVYDTSEDGFVTPIDALLIINLINLGLEAPAGAVDVNFDGFLSAIDVLLVINQLNVGPSIEGEMSEAAAPSCAYLVGNGVQDWNYDLVEPRRRSTVADRILRPFRTATLPR